MRFQPGCRQSSFFDHAQGCEIPLTILYPGNAPTSPVRFGPYTLEVALDATPAPGLSKLIVISHGNGGSPWVHRDLARHLVCNGYTVALPEHLGNSRSDNSLAGTKANLENRPRHLSLCIDAVLGTELIGERLTGQPIAIIGHSIGAYTALAAAGGKPMADLNELRDGQSSLVVTQKDRRVSALILLAPATPWYQVPGALADVQAPIFMRTGSADQITTQFHADIVLNGLPPATAIEHQIVEGAGHFSFQSCFPAAMKRPDFPPSQDPPGFDRAAYQAVLAEEVLAFVSRVL